MTNKRVIPPIREPRHAPAPEAIAVSQLHSPWIWGAGHLRRARAFGSFTDVISIAAKSRLINLALLTAATVRLPDGQAQRPTMRFQMLACPGMTLLAGPAAVQNIPRVAVAAKEFCNRPVYDRRLSAGAQPSKNCQRLRRNESRRITNSMDVEKGYRFLVDS